MPEIILEKGRRGSLVLWNKRCSGSPSSPLPQNPPAPPAQALRPHKTLPRSRLTGTFHPLQLSLYLQLLISTTYSQYIYNIFTIYLQYLHL